jgi:GT2 family glycosyltransferase
LFIPNAAQAGMRMANSVCTIVLSYNDPACTVACIESLLSGSTAAGDIVVVDNASADGGAAAIKASFPDIPSSNSTRTLDGRAATMSGSGSL